MIRAEFQWNPLSAGSTTGCIVLGIALSLFVAYFRETYIDRMSVVLCVLGMSVSTCSSHSRRSR